MSKRGVFSDLIAQTKARFDDGVKALFGTGEDWSVRSDGTDLIFEEEGTGEIFRVNTGNNFADELESGGSTPIAQGGLNEQDPTAHATEHENGGVDEISVGGLSGDLADAQDPKNHATNHEDGGPDEVTLENLPTGSTDTTLVLKPNGNGGVQFVAEQTGATTSDNLLHNDGFVPDFAGPEL